MGDGSDPNSRRISIILRYHWSVQFCGFNTNKEEYMIQVCGGFLDSRLLLHEKRKISYHCRDHD